MRKRSGVEAADVPLGGRLAEIRRITQRYQERTDWQVGQRGQTCCQVWTFHYNTGRYSW